MGVIGVMSRYAGFLAFLERGSVGGCSGYSYT